MGRPQRSYDQGHIFHIVNRGVARAAIFNDDRDRVEFERLIGVSHERFGVQALAYCWMTNHFHLVLSCPDGGLSEAMHLLGSVYVRHFNERHGRDGPLFRSRFFARPISSEAYLLRAVRYVHRNPLAFVRAPELMSYRWSSLRSYGLFRRPPDWLSTALVADIHGGRGQVVAAALDHADSTGVLTASDWQNVVELAVDEHFPDHHGARVVPTVTTLLLDRLPVDQRKELEAVYPTAQARRAAAYRARRRLKDSPELAGAVELAMKIAA